MTEVRANANSEVGQIKIADEVIAIIAGVAAYEIPGILFGASTAAEGELHRIGRRQFSKSVKVKMNEKDVVVDIYVGIRFGFKIRELSEEVQKRVKSALETMVGMRVKEVNVHITGIQFDKPTKVVRSARKTT
ncbi:MAG: Asp23/Gls24 family envelope stress response protein [Defluviitaleaceae bacterium]|nr:Asp23/Gls24 family envelope stress response protein [Defluviitaleaceae bacterium]